MRLAVLLLLLIYISLAPALWLTPVAALALLLGRPDLFARASLVLPFSATLALAAALSGDPNRAAILLAKSYLSALAAVHFAATTPVPVWTSTLRSWRVAPILISTLEFLHRYLSVLAAEARTMATAARARGGFRFAAAAGAVATLFARSFRRADAVHRAMLARGYQAP